MNSYFLRSHHGLRATKVSLVATSIGPQALDALHEPGIARATIPNSFRSILSAPVQSQRLQNHLPPTQHPPVAVETHDVLLAYYALVFDGTPEGRMLNCLIGLAFASEAMCNVNLRT